GMIIDRQNAHTRQVGRNGYARIAPRSGGVNRLLVPHRRLDDGERKRDREDCAAARAWTGCADRSAVQLDQVLGDRQSQTQASLTPRGHAIVLTKSVEDMR